MAETHLNKKYSSNILLRLLAKLRVRSTCAKITVDSGVILPLDIWQKLTVAESIAIH